MEPKRRSSRVGRRAAAVAAARIVALFALGTGCGGGGDRTVVLPPESLAYERFLNAGGTLTADVIRVQAVRAYLKDCVPVVSAEAHSKSLSPDRIVLENEIGLQNQPVRLGFRNLQLVGRERIEVTFSDVPLEDPEGGAPILLFVASGVAHLRAAGEDFVAECIVVRNDEARAFRADCKTPATPVTP